VFDLPAAKARYHQPCSINFRTGRDIPQKYSNKVKRGSTGRPVDHMKLDAFNKALDWWENSHQDSVTIPELFEKMKQYCSEPYTAKRIKEKLKEHYGADVRFFSNATCATSSNVSVKYTRPS
jgi:hypothetical protein